MRIGGLQPLTLSDYPGHLAAIIFTVGCNFACGYCHNKILLDEKSAPNISEEEVLIFLKEKYGRLNGVVVTGGEPTIQADLPDFLAKIKALGYDIKLDTNGNNPQLLKKLLELKLVDFIAMDIKAPLAHYAKVAQQDVDIANILASIKLIIDSNVAHIFRTTWDKQLLTDADIAQIIKLIPNDQLLIQECIKPKI